MVYTRRAMALGLHSHKVTLAPVATYEASRLDRALPDEVFDQVRRGDRVVLKPNWVFQSHKYRTLDWDYVVTHPAVITAVLRKILPRLGRSGSVAIVDGPATDASFRELIGRYPVTEWHALASSSGVELEVIDLRDHEWEVRNDIVVKRHKRVGDPRGSSEFDLLDDASEFHGHVKSERGYYGADYDRAETNQAHDGRHNRYRVSRTVIEADLFVNLPKLKTHRKSGITCCLKNLVGINTYRNYLPHHSEGGPAERGDQFPTDSTRARVEGPLMGFLKQRVLGNPRLARFLSPVNTLGRRVFGDSREVVRSGNWYGNDTIWRMILDLNKVLLYGNSDGTLRADAVHSAKRYIGVVDAVLAGDGNGPLAPDRVHMGYLIAGTNPVALDAVAAKLMGYASSKLPTIRQGFAVQRYPLCAFEEAKIAICRDGSEFDLAEIPPEWIVPCKPHFGWQGHIEEWTSHGLVAS